MSSFRDAKGRIVSSAVADPLRDVVRGATSDVPLPTTRSIHSVASRSYGGRTSVAPSVWNTTTSPRVNVHRRGPHDDVVEHPEEGAGHDRSSSRRLADVHRQRMAAARHV